jgi:hypothetical protein
MTTSVVVWNLETIPDLAGFAAADDLVGKSAADIRAAGVAPAPRQSAGARR